MYVLLRREKFKVEFGIDGMEGFAWEEFYSNGIRMAQSVDNNT